MTETKLATKIKTSAAKTVTPAETLEDILEASDFTETEKSLGEETKESPPAQDTVVHEYRPSIEAYINTEGSVTIDLGRNGSFFFDTVEELSDILAASEPEKEEPSVVSQYRFYRPDENLPMPTHIGQVDAEIGHLNQIRRGLFTKWDAMSGEERNHEHERAKAANG